MNEEKQTSKTFKQLYEDAKNMKPEITPAKAFIQRCMKATMKTEATVRCWLCGARNPERLERELLAKEFGCPVDELFPMEQNEEAKEE